MNRIYILDHRGKKHKAKYAVFFVPPNNHKQCYITIYSSLQPAIAELKAARWCDMFIYDVSGNIVAYTTTER